MTDLKQEITRIQNFMESQKNTYTGTNVWYEITKLAYERGELLKLLSADDEYAYDALGDLWLARPSQLGPDEDPIAMGLITSNGINKIYFETDSDSFKETFVSAFNDLLQGNFVQFYFAIQIFCTLVEMEKDDELSFADWLLEESFVEELYPKVRLAVNTRYEQLDKHFVFNSKFYDDGLLGWCKYKSNALLEFNAEGFMGE